MFRAKQSDRAVLVIASGDKRVDEKKLKAALGEPVGRADADFVRAKTGFAIGGVPPIGHAERHVAFVEDSLWCFEQIWAAAGTPNAVFKTGPDALLKITDGTRADLAQD